MKNNIAFYRKKAGLSQTEVKEKLCLSSTGTVSQWETGSRNPSVELLPKLASVLGCTIDDLFRKDEANVT